MKPPKPKRRLRPEEPQHIIMAAPSCICSASNTCVFTRSALLLLRVQGFSVADEEPQSRMAPPSCRSSSPCHGSPFLHMSCFQRMPSYLASFALAECAGLQCCRRTIEIHGASVLCTPQHLNRAEPLTCPHSLQDKVGQTRRASELCSKQSSILRIAR